MNTDTPDFPRWKAILLALRAPFLTGSLVPIVVGASFAYYQGYEHSVPLLLLTLGAMVFLHLGANLANDFFDHLSGNDAANENFVRPFTGGSRVIQQGILSPSAILTMASMFLLAGVGVGLFIAYRTGWPVLALGVVGTVVAIFYTAPPLKLVSRGLGEPAVGVCFGILPVLGAYYVQTGTVSREVLLVSIPTALLITAVLFINQFQDMEADRQVGKCNWVVRLGRRRAVIPYLLLTSLWVIPLLAGVCLLDWPPALLAACLPALLLIKATPIVRAFHSDSQALSPANGMTIVMHLSSGLITALVFYLS